MQALGHRLHSCGTWASLLRGIWDLPGPGVEPMSPALAGGLFATEPSEKLMAFSLNDLDTDSFHLAVCHDLGSWNPLHIPDRKERKVENPAS